MPVSFDKLKIGEKYDRSQLTDLWGLRGQQAISRGIYTPANDPYIVLFVTRDKGSYQPDYKDELIDTLDKSRFGSFPYHPYSGALGL